MLSERLNIQQKALFLDRQITEAEDKFVKNLTLGVGNTDDWRTWIQIFLVNQWDGHYALCPKGNIFHPPTSIP